LVYNQLVNGLINDKFSLCFLYIYILYVLLLSLRDDVFIICMFVDYCCA
jgi:hypothetical protein